MAFNDTKNIEDVINASDWNDFVDYVEDISGQTYWISGSYIGHSGNTDIHYPSSQFRTWLDQVYAPSGVSGDTSSQVTLSDGLEIDGVGLFHDAAAQTLGLNNVPQTVLASGTQYYQAYQHSSSTDNPHGVTAVQVGAEPSVSWVAVGDGTGINSVDFKASGTGSPTISIDFSTVASSNHLHEGVYEPDVTWGTIQDGDGISNFEFKASGDATISVDWSTVASGSHTHADLYYPSSLGNGISGTLNSHVADTNNPHSVVWGDVSSAAYTELDNVYAPSGVAGSDTSSQVTLASGLADSLGSNLWHDGDATTLYLVSSSKYDEAYDFSSNASSLFYPSTMGYGVSGTLNSHIGNTSNPHQVVWSDVSTAAKTDLNDDYYPSSVGAALSGNFQAHEADSTIHYAQGDITTVGTVTTGTIRQVALASGTQYYQAYLSGQNAFYTSADVDHDATTNFVANEHINHTLTLTAGNGLTGGGDITTGRTFAVGEGTGITVAADTVSTNDGEIVHDSLSGFVANEHIDHSTVTLTAGNGLTGGGTIAANRTFAVGPGALIDVAADTVSVDLSELTDGTGDIVGSADEMVYLDAGSQKRKQIDEIKLSQFNNDAFLEKDGTVALTGDWNFGTGHRISGGGAGLQLHPSGIILPHFTGSGGSWPGGDSPPLGLMWISGS